MGTKNKHKKNAKHKESTAEEESKETTNVPDSEMADAAGPVDANMTEQVDDGSGQKKSYRKRKKHYYNAIRAQMEFYFGDANLSKDRFLKQLLDKDPCKF